MPEQGDCSPEQGDYSRRTGKELAAEATQRSVACEVVSAPVIRTSDDAHGPRGDRAKAPARAEAAGDDRGRRLGRAARAFLKSFLASPAARRLAAVQHFGDRGGDRRPNEGGKFVLSRARARPVSWATISWTSSAIVARTLALHRFPQDVLPRRFLALGAAGGTASTSHRGGVEAVCGANILPHEGDLPRACPLDLDEL